MALLAILALALSAATLDSAVVTDRASGLGGDEEGFGDERRQSDDPRLGGGVDGNGSSAGGAPFANCWPGLREPPVLAGLGLGFLGLFGAAYRSTRSVFAGLVVCGGVAIPVGLVFAALAYCAPPSSGGQSDTGIGPWNVSDSPAGGAGGVGDAGLETLSAPTILLVLFVVIAVGVAAVAVLVTGRDDDRTEPEPDAAAAERIGRVAGAAADRIDDEPSIDTENEVYRAWRRMTGSLDVDDPETTPPREFERAAVDAGMAPDDVAALTSLFEAVRYGGRDATASTERRAVETLRRIEAGYGGE
jgi:hypothetical protein